MTIKHFIKYTVANYVPSDINRQQIIDKYS